MIKKCPGGCLLGEMGGLKTRHRALSAVWKQGSDVLESGKTGKWCSGGRAHRIGNELAPEGEEEGRVRGDQERDSLGNGAVAYTWGTLATVDLVGKRIFALGRSDMW